MTKTELSHLIAPPARIAPTLREVINRDTMWGSDWRLVKMGRKWWVRSIESVDDLLPPSFTTKREASDYASRNAEAVIERLQAA